MDDLRSFVESNRGLLKEIELSIPGFRGYRVREDIRSADNIIRTYLADQLESSVQMNLKRVRDMLSKSLELDLLNDLGELLNMNKGLEAKIRHADHGYSGISPQYRIEEPELNRIYEFDTNLVKSIKDIQIKSEVLLDQTRKNAVTEIKKSFSLIKFDIEYLNELIDKREWYIIGLISNQTGM